MAQKDFTDNKVSPFALVYGDLYLMFSGVINFIYKLSYHSQFGSWIYLDKPASSFKGIEIGKNSSSSGVIRLISFSLNTTSVKIGSYVRIAEGCWLMLNSRHTPGFVSNHMNGLILDDERAIAIEETLYRKKMGKMSASIDIGNDVWIGGNVTIIGNRKIGDGAVIAAGSIVTSDVEAYSVVGGVPAKLIKYRFDKATIDSLKRIKWWEWSREKILDHIEIFYDPKKFVKKFSRK